METLNLIFLSLHNIIRWIVLVLGIVLVVRSFLGWFKKWEYQERDKKLTPFYAGVFDLQILLGIILFFTKGWGGVLMNAPGEVMKTAALRFFVVEHWTMMILAALQKAGGNKAKAARILNIDRSTLYRKMHALHMDIGMVS